MSTTTTATAPLAQLERTRPLQSAYARFLHLENTIHYQLVKHSITALRIALGLIFLGFGFLKFFPGVSPAQPITEATTHILFLGLISGAASMKMIASLECVIGVCLLSNRGMRLAVWLLGIEFIGILAPIFLFPAHLFSGPHHAPTLLAQYCLKDIILVAGALVVAAGSFRGGRMIRTDLPPNVSVRGTGVTDPNEKLAIVLRGIHEPDELPAALELHNISESEFHDWREAVLTSANQALTVPVVADDTMIAVVDERRDAPAPTPSLEAHPVGRWTLALLVLAILRRS